MKNPLTPAGIEPATFWFVAQHLNNGDRSTQRIFHNYIWIKNHSTEEKLQISWLLNRHYMEFKLWNYTFHKYTYFKMLLKWPSLITAPTYALCVSMMTVPTITKDSQQQDDVTTLPTRSATSLLYHYWHECHHASKMSCLYKILILSDYHTYEQATQWAYVNMTNKPRGSDNR